MERVENRGSDEGWFKSNSVNLTRGVKGKADGFSSASWTDCDMDALVHLIVLLILSAVTNCSRDEDFCPEGARIDRDGWQCYWISASASTWREARTECEKPNRADLASVDKPSVQKFIENSFL
ncbi:polycystin-1-like isoform X2, partial [Clarias magur]